MSDSFCVLPWFSQEIDIQNKPCCLLPSNFNIDRLKQDLLNGVRSEFCKKCWDLESTGHQSRRQFENKFLDYKLDRDLKYLIKDCAEEKQETLLYQITTSNLCNQACVSCNSRSSSKWVQIEQKMGAAPFPPFTLDISKHNINYKNAKRISLLGGEPFFDPAAWAILEQLVASNNTNCFVSLITNGSIKLNEQQLSLLKQFSDLNICISIDGVGPVFEYMRWPGKWDNLVKNLENYKTLTKNISASYTLSSLNAAYYNKTVEWFEQQGIRHNHNIVTHPIWLSLTKMPVELKNHLKTHNNFITNYCNIDGSEVKLKVLAQNIVKQDQAKNIDIHNYMPEVADIIFGTV